MASSRGGYTEPGQLQDVLALHQVLAFAPEPSRTVVQLADALWTPPSSGRGTWGEVTSLHPKLFRGFGAFYFPIRRPGGGTRISLPIPATPD